LGTNNQSEPLANNKIDIFLGANHSYPTFYPQNIASSSISFTFRH